MTDTSASAPAPKKRSFFKRAAWQDAAKKDSDDMFSHSNEFKDIVAEQTNRREEEKRREEEQRQQRQLHSHEKKRRKVSNENEQPTLPRSGSGSSARASRTATKARSRTPLSPAPSHPPPDSLTERYDSLTKSASLPRKESVIIDLDDEDDNYSGLNFKPSNHNSDRNYPSWQGDCKHDLAVRSSKRPPADDDDELEEVLDPTLAALKAKARERAAQRAQSAATTAIDGEPSRNYIVQLLIVPEIPDAEPLLIKVRMDDKIGKPRLAWCGRQGYSPEMTESVFFTWKGTRIYDSNRIKRLGIQLDKDGNISVDGDTNIYDDVNVPKVVVEAWTEAVFQQRKKEDAAEAAAKKQAAEAPPEIEEKEPTPEPAPQVSKVRLILKAKGKEECRLLVNPETTFAHIANAYKTKLKIDKHQPVTLMFDGERLSPLDSVADSEAEDMDSIDVLFK